MESVRTSEMSAVQPTSTWCHHQETDSTLELNHHESVISSNWFWSLYFNNESILNFMEICSVRVEILHIHWWTV